MTDFRNILCQFLIKSVTNFRKKQASRAGLAISLPLIYVINSASAQQEDSGEKSSTQHGVNSVLLQLQGAYDDFL